MKSYQLQPLVKRLLKAMLNTNCGENAVGRETDGGENKLSKQTNNPISSICNSSKAASYYIDTFFSFYLL